MRMTLILILAFVVLATAALALYARTYQMRAEVWHVDPAEVVDPPAGNSVLLRGDDAPRLDGTPAEVAARLDAVAEAEGATRLAGDPAEGHVTYVVRSRIFGYPDAVTIRLHEVPDDGTTRVDIFSRSAIGESDFGVNAARVSRWIDAAS